MSEFLLCCVEDTFPIAGRGLIVAPSFPVSAYRFDAAQQVRVVRPDGERFVCCALFRIPFQSPPAKVHSFICVLPTVAKERVPIGSEIWLLGKAESEVRPAVTSDGQVGRIAAIRRRGK